MMKLSPIPGVLYDQTLRYAALVQQYSSTFFSDNIVVIGVLMCVIFVLPAGRSGTAYFPNEVQGLN